MKVEILNSKAIKRVNKVKPNYCRICGGICEFGFPFYENGRKVMYLYCNEHGRIAKVYLD